MKNENIEEYIVSNNLSGDEDYNSKLNTLINIAKEGNYGKLINKARMLGFFEDKEKWLKLDFLFRQIVEESNDYIPEEPKEGIECSACSIDNKEIEEIDKEITEDIKSLVESVVSEKLMYVNNKISEKEDNIKRLSNFLIVCFTVSLVSFVVSTITYFLIR